MKVLVVLSGGMDSATALAWAKRHESITEVEAVSFYYGSKHNDREFRGAQAVCEHYGVPLKRIDLGFINECFKSDLLQSGGEIPEGHYADPSMKRTVVPFRNGIMLSIAAGYAESIGAQAVVLGNHFGDHAIYPDCREEFAQMIGAAMRLGTYAGVELIAPFCKVDKTEIARLGGTLGVPYELTYSCYNGREKHCGKCGTCYERKEAFLQSGVADPTEYEV